LRGRPGEAVAAADEEIFALIAASDCAGAQTKCSLQVY
jgi:hypothetical protein